MFVIDKAVDIKAAPAKVFDVVTAPDNWTRYVTSLVEVKNLSEGAPAKGSTFTWTYKMMGVKFSGKGEVTTCTKNKAFGLALMGKTQVNESYEFLKNEDGSTKLKIKIEYELPSKIMEILADNKLAKKLNDLEANAVLQKIKAMCEA